MLGMVPALGRPNRQCLRVFDRELRKGKRGGRISDGVGQRRAAENGQERRVSREK